MRTYILHVPTGYTGKTPIPVVVDYHSLGSTSSGEKGISGYATLGDTGATRPSFLGDRQRVEHRSLLHDVANRRRPRVHEGARQGRADEGLRRSEAHLCRWLLDGRRHVALPRLQRGGPLRSDRAGGVRSPDRVRRTCDPSRPEDGDIVPGTPTRCVNYDGGASMPPSGLQGHDSLSGRARHLSEVGAARRVHRLAERAGLQRLLDLLAVQGRGRGDAVHEAGREP